MLACALGMVPARADSVDFREARLAPRDEGWALEAEFDIELSGRLEEAVNKGVALYFTLEFPNRPCCAGTGWTKKPPSSPRATSLITRPSDPLIPAGWCHSR